MWTSINCFSGRKRSDSVDLLLLLLFPSFSTHYPPKKHGRNLQYRENSLSVSGAHLWKKITACKITGLKILSWTTLYLGCFCIFPPLCVQDESKGIVMGNCCAYWMFASPFRNCPALLWERCWSLRSYGRCRVARLPSPASPGSSSCVEDAQLPKTSTTPHTGCFHSMKLIFRDVVEMPRILGCRAAESDIPLLTLLELLNSQAFWTNIDTFIPDNTFGLKKTISRCKPALNQMHVFCCLQNEFAVGCPKLPDKLCTYSLFVLHTGKLNAWQRYWANNSPQDANLCA